MGKVQAKTSKNNDLLDNFQQKIKMKSNSLDMKIEKEYMRILKMTKALGKISPLKIPFLKGKKKTPEEIFIKWYELISTKNKQNGGTPAKTSSKFHSLNLNSPSMNNLFKSQFYNLLADLNPPTDETLLSQNVIQEFSSMSGFKEKSLNRRYENIKSKVELSMTELNLTEKQLRSYTTKNSDKFSRLVLKGPPELFRWISWIILNKIPEERSNKLYYSLLKIPINKNSDDLILKDLNKTLCDDNIFLHETTRNSLYRLLKTFMLYDQEVSYSHGIKFISGFLLIVSDFNEVESFQMLISIFSKDFSKKICIKGFFVNNFPLLKLYIYQFDYLFMRYLPLVKKHFDELKIVNEFWVMKWYKTLFTDCLSYEIVSRLWDCLIIKGLAFLHNFTLAILQYLSTELLKCKDGSHVIEVLNSINPYEKNFSKNNFNKEEILQNSLNFDIPFSLLIKLKSRYEELFKSDLSNRNNIYQESDQSLSNIYEDLSCSLSAVDSFSICENFPMKCEQKKTMNYMANHLSTNITFKNEDEYISDSETIRDISVFSDANLIEKSKIDKIMKNYTFKTKIINKNTYH